LGLGAVAIFVLLSRKGELTGSAQSFRHLRYWWIAPAVAAEAVSIVCFAFTLGRLLREAHRPLAARPLLALTLASNAIANSLPAGPAFGAAYSYRRLRVHGVPELVAVWAMLAAGVLASAALALMAAVGTAAAADLSSDLGLAGVIGGTLVICLGLLVLLHRPGLVAPPVSLGASWLRRLVGWPHTDPRRLAADVRDRLAVVRLHWSGIAGALAWALGNWAFDLGCLLLAFMAVRSAIPWGGLLLAYGAAQLAANLPITPGGLGVVEGSLTISLIAYGGAEAASVAAVLVYRVLSFWVPLLIGWAVAGRLALDDRRRRHPPPESSDFTGADGDNLTEVGP
jgi:hypothetical protein